MSDISNLQDFPVNYVCGIYGYHVTHPINLTDYDLRIDPVTNDDDVKLRADNRQSYQLTAILTGKSIPTNVCFNLEAILSFIEGRDVLITSQEDLTNEVSPGSQFTECIRMPARGKISNKAICRSKHTSRASFIINALTRLNYEEDELKRLKIEPREKGEDLPNIPLFNALFFKYVESFRQNIFSDIEYYLLFSGLEAYAMNWAKSEGLLNPNPKKPFCSTCGYLIPKQELKKCPDCVNLQQKMANHKSAADVISRFLNKEGDVFGATYHLKPDSEDGKHKYNPHAAMDAYAHLRNKLVHENKFSSTSFTKTNGEIVPLSLFEYKPRLEILVMLVILKEVDFDDNDTDYKLWLNLQPS
jgi:hypothetical protein